MNYLPEGSECVPNKEYTTQQYSTRRQKGRMYPRQSSSRASYHDAEVAQEDDSINDEETLYLPRQDPQDTIERPASRYSDRNENTTYGYNESRLEQYSCQSCGETFVRAGERNRHYQTVHVGNAERNFRCDIEDCAAGVTNWRRQDGLGKHNKTWHSYSCEEPGCSRAYPRGFESQTALELHRQAAHPQTPQSMYEQPYNAPEDPVDRLSSSLQMASFTSSSRYIFEPARPPSSISNNRRAATNPPSSKLVISGTQGQNEQLDRRYKVQPSSFFKPGKVFKILWTEPSTRKGENLDSDVSETEPVIKYGEVVYTSIRRFVVIRTFPGHSQCLPIYTYGERGLLKQGVVAEYHAKIFISDSERARSDLEIQETRLLTRASIRIRPDRDDEKLDSMSRLNYSKVYTVEHNVKVLSVGRVDKKCEPALIRDFDEIHQPLSDTTWGQSAINQQSRDGVGYGRLGGKGIEASTDYASYEEVDGTFENEHNSPNEFGMAGPSQTPYSTYNTTYETSDGPSYEDSPGTYQVDNTEEDPYASSSRFGSAATMSIDSERRHSRSRGDLPDRSTSRRQRRDSRRR